MQSVIIIVNDLSISCLLKVFESHNKVACRKIFGKVVDFDQVSKLYSMAKNSYKSTAR